MKDGRIPPKTLTGRRLTKVEREYSEIAEYPDGVARPNTRGDCHAMPRPCPFVSCVHHLYLDVNARTGAIKLNFPHLEVWELDETCSLDVADRGGETLEWIGKIYGITRERVRQIVEKATRLRRVRDALREFMGL